MGIRISIPEEKVVDFCKRWDITELAFFGSVLRDDFGPESDIDVLVNLRPEINHRISSILRMEKELSDILGRDVDLVFRPDVERSRNYLRREAVLKFAEVIIKRRSRQHEEGGKAWFEFH